MAIKKPTKKTPGRRDPNDAPKEKGSLDLPDAPNFISMPPTVSPAQAMILRDQIATWFPNSVPSRKERLAQKVNVEFTL